MKHSSKRVLVIAIQFFLFACSTVTVTEFPPALVLDFTQGTLPSPLAFTRNSPATYFDENGVLKTAAANTPRFDYDPTTGMLRGLLIEEHRTNLLTHSEQFDQWGYVNIHTNANATTALTGERSADQIIPTASSERHAIWLNSSIATIDTFYSFSCYFKPNGYNVIGLYLSGQHSAKSGYMFDVGSNRTTAVSGATATQLFSPAIQPLRNGYYRCSFSARLPQLDGLTATIQIRPDFQVSEQYAADGKAGGYLWGAQLEMGASLTSYIPTGSSTAYRETDLCLISTLANWFNPSEGTWIAETVLGTRRVARIVGYDWSGNFLGISPRGPSTTETWNGWVNLTQTGTQTTGIVRHGMSYNQTSRTITREGLPPVTSNTPNGRISQIAIGANPNGREPLNAHIRRVVYYNYRQPNELLQRHTQ